MQAVKIDKNLIEQAKESSKSANVLFSGAVNKLHERSKGMAKRILIVTKQYICYFKESDTKNPDHQHFWTNLKRYNSKFPQIDLEFEGENEKGNDLFRFQSDEAELIQNTIFDILLHELSKNELMPLNLNRYSLPDYHVNGDGIMNRYESVAIQDGKTISNSIEQQLHDYVASSNKIFKLKTDPELEDQLTSICQALIPYTHLDSIEMPNINNAIDYYNVLSTILYYHLSIRHLSISNQPDEKFETFAQALKATDSLTGITFKDVFMIQNDFAVLEKVINSLPNFRSISFQNILKNSTFDSFKSEVLTGYVTNRLQMFNLDHTQCLDIEKISSIIKDLPVINSLSFAECNLDVAETLKIISTSNINSLRFLNLSGNKAISPFTDITNLPKEIIRIDVNNLEWEEGIFPTFIKFIFNYRFKKGLRLYIENTNVSQQDWSAAIELINNCDYNPLTELGWSGNPISSEFLNFLKGNLKLHSLFVSDSFTEQNESQFKLFVEEINNLKALKNLVIRGTSEKHLGQKILPLFDTLINHPSISLLDVTGQEIGNEGLNKLRNLVEQQRSLNYLIFDNSKFTDLQLLSNLIEAGKSRNTPICIQYPLPDIRENDFPSEELEKLISGIQEARQSRTSNKNENEDQKSKSAFEKPFEYFVSEFTDKFPIYINEDLEKEFDINFKKLKGGNRSKRHSKKPQSQENIENNDESDEWVEEEEIVEPEEEEEQLESPEHKQWRENLQKLYDEMDFTKQQYDGLVERVPEPEDDSKIQELKQKYSKITPLVNELVPK